METLKEVREGFMKVVVRISDVMALARRFEQSPTQAMQEVMTQMRDGCRHALEQVMEAEIQLFLGQEAEVSNKRNGYRERTFGVKGLGTLVVRVPRDRAGKFSSNVVPSMRRYDVATEKDLALLNLAGISTYPYEDGRSATG
jgi:transposase-like protein